MRDESELSHADRAARTRAARAQAAIRSSLTAADSPALPPKRRCLKSDVYISNRTYVDHSRLRVHLGRLEGHLAMRPDTAVKRTEALSEGADHFFFACLEMNEADSAQETLHVATKVLQLAQANLGASRALRCRG